MWEQFFVCLGILHWNVAQGTRCFGSYWFFMNDDALICTWLFCFNGSLAGRTGMEGGPNLSLEYNNF